jgi:hypothetical protein
MGSIRGRRWANSRFGSAFAMDNGLLAQLQNPHT